MASEPTVAGKDYILQIRVRNGPLMRAIRMRGYQSVQEFCDRNDLPPHTIYDYLALRRAPTSKTNKAGSEEGFAPSAVRMAKALKLPVFALFPEQHLDQALRRSSGELEISKEEIKGIIAPQSIDDPETELRRKQLSAALYRAMELLTPREERVLRLRYGLNDEGEHTLREVGEKFDLSHDRIRQIEAKALRRMRSGERARVLQAAHDGPVPLKKLRQGYYYPERLESFSKIVQTENEILRETNAARAPIDWPQWEGDEGEYPRWDKPLPGMAIQRGSFVLVREADEHKIPSHERPLMALCKRENGVLLFRWTGCHWRPSE